MSILKHFFEKFLPLSIILIILIYASDISSKTLDNKDKEYYKNEAKSPPREIETVSIPIILSIPKLGLQASIELVGIDSQGRMDVPSSFYTVGWYKYGPRPGEKGNSVIDGHYDTYTGDAAVFYNLDLLNRNDVINITDQNGKTYVFKITQVYTYQFDDVRLEKIFGKTQKRMLNLITCAGYFDHVSNNYSHRVVIFSELIE